MTKAKFALCMVALTVGSSLQPIREYWTTGTVSRFMIAGAVAAFCVGLVMVLVMTWWANRPEHKDSDE